MTVMHLSYRQEAFSVAYVRAVAAVAGFRVQEGAQPDDDSVDLTLAARGPYGALRSPKLDVQLKCTLRCPTGDLEFAYDLKAKNYEDLRQTNFQVPRILVVVAVPEDVSEWVAQDDEQLTMRHCGWWISLRGMAASANSEKVRIKIPFGQRFDVSQLEAMMARIGDGGVP